MASTLEPSGSLLIRRARLVPVGGAAPQTPVDVLIRDGVVTDIAPRISAPGVEYMDLDGRWLMPGLWDQHVHLGQWVVASGRLDLSAAVDVSSACAAVRTRLAAHPGVPVVAWGHRPLTWADQPTVTALDTVSDTVPIVLIAGDGHHGWLNSPALRLLGLPPRDGVVAEAEWFAAYPRLADAGLSGDGSPAAYEGAMRELAGLGVVGVVDLEFAVPVDAWGERVAAGVDVLKVRTGVYPEHLDDYLRAGLRTGMPLPGCSPRQSFAVLKIISDGSLNTGTAWCCEPYPTEAGGPIDHGAANYSIDELDALMSRAVAAGVEVATHAIGDAAVAQALDLHERWSAHGSIEHAQLIRREDVARLARLGLRASVQPAHLLDDRDPTEQHWPDRADRCFALRWMHDAGVQLALGSDAPVSPLDPWLAMAAAVHRSADGREPWHPEQSLTVAEALAASVDGQGTVAVGMPGDLIALDESPLPRHRTETADGHPPPSPRRTETAAEVHEVSRAEAARLRRMRSSLTVIDGRVAHTDL